ncbi:AURKAIP1/COX24 domain-containing protein [Chlamydia pneumoniae]
MTKGMSNRYVNHKDIMSSVKKKRRLKIAKHKRKKRRRRDRHKNK